MNAKEFEHLVAWINECLHQNAVIKVNDKIKDVNTKRMRQIDISVRFKNGPLDILCIIEARDRSRPVSIEYIEQINSKIKSVNADIGIIVSSKGFYNSALIKANNYGIRTFSLQEALTNDWSTTICNSKFFLHVVESINPIIYFIDKEKNKIIDIHPNTISEIEKFGVNHLAFMDENNCPYKSLEDIYKLCLNTPELLNALKRGKENAISLKIYAKIELDKKIYFKDKDNIIRELNFICLKGEFWIDEKKLSPYVSQYRNDSDELLAEIVNVKMPDNTDVNILFEKPNKTNEDRKVHVKYNK